MQYYIAFSAVLKNKEFIKKGKVIAYGETLTGTSGITPISAEEIFDDFKLYKKRLKELGFKI